MNKQLIGGMEGQPFGGKQGTSRGAPRYETMIAGEPVGGWPKSTSGQPRSTSGKVARRGGRQQYGISHADLAAKAPEQPLGPPEMTHAGARFASSQERAAADAADAAAATARQEREAARHIARDVSARELGVMQAEDTGGASAAAQLPSLPHRQRSAASEELALGQQALENRRADRAAAAQLKEQALERTGAGGLHLESSDSEDSGSNWSGSESGSSSEDESSSGSRPPLNTSLLRSRTPALPIGSPPTNPTLGKRSGARPAPQDRKEELERMAKAAVLALAKKRGVPNLPRGSTARTKEENIAAILELERAPASGSPPPSVAPPPPSPPPAPLPSSHLSHPSQIARVANPGAALAAGTTVPRRSPTRVSAAAAASEAAADVAAGRARQNELDTANAARTERVLQGAPRQHTVRAHGTGSGGAGGDGGDGGGGGGGGGAVAPPSAGAWDLQANEVADDQVAEVALDLGVTERRERERRLWEEDYPGIPWFDPESELSGPGVAQRETAAHDLQRQHLQKPIVAGEVEALRSELGEMNGHQLGQRATAIGMAPADVAGKSEAELIKMIVERERERMRGDRAEEAADAADFMELYKEQPDPWTHNEIMELAALTQADMDEHQHNLDIANQECHGVSEQIARTRAKAQEIYDALEKKQEELRKCLIRLNTEKKKVDQLRRNGNVLPDRDEFERIKSEKIMLRDTIALLRRDLERCIANETALLERLKEALIDVQRLRLLLEKCRELVEHYRRCLAQLEEEARDVADFVANLAAAAKQGLPARAGAHRTLDQARSKFVFYADNPANYEGAHRIAFVVDLTQAVTDGAGADRIKQLLEEWAASHSDLFREAEAHVAVGSETPDRFQRMDKASIENYSGMDLTTVEKEIQKQRDYIGHRQTAGTQRNAFAPDGKPWARTAGPNDLVVCAKARLRGLQEARAVLRGESTVILDSGERVEVGAHSSESVLPQKMGFEADKVQLRYDAAGAPGVATVDEHGHIREQADPNRVTEEELIRDAQRRGQITGEEAVEMQEAADTAQERIRQAGHQIAPASERDTRNVDADDPRTARGMGGFQAVPQQSTDEVNAEERSLQEREQEIWDRHGATPADPKPAAADQDIADLRRRYSPAGRVPGPAYAVTGVEAQRRNVDPEAAFQADLAAATAAGRPPPLRAHYEMGAGGPRVQAAPDVGRVVTENLAGSPDSGLPHEPGADTLRAQAVVEPDAGGGGGGPALAPG
jgi:hypothetical protein